MLAYVRIQATGLPVLLPSESFVDTHYGINRVKCIGYYEESFFTDRKYQTWHDTTHIERPIQHLVYRKYKTKLYANEYSTIMLLKYAGIATIQLNNSDVHTAKILDIEQIKQADTDLYIYAITYYDVNLQNYLNEVQPVVNLLESNYLKALYPAITGAGRATYYFSFSSIAYLPDTEFGTINEGSPAYPYVTYRSILRPIFSISEPKEQVGELNGLKTVSYSARQRQVTLVLFMHETEMTQVVKYATVWSPLTMKIFDKTTTYTAIEAPVVEVSELAGAVDLYQVRITLKYSNLEINHYDL